MTEATTRRRPSRRRRLVWALILVVAMTVGAIVFVVVQFVPGYRTTLLIDTSATDSADFAAVRTAVVATADNAGGGDAMALRRFGGTCADPGNTAEVVGSGIGNRQKIGRAARTLASGGQATLGSGILAAIDDFSGRYPFRGRDGNRIVIVTSHGIDACTSNPAVLRAAVQKRAEEVGVDLSLRFIGYKVPTRDQAALTQLATAGGGDQRSAFVSNPADLTATLRKFTLPTSADPKTITLPAQVVTAKLCTPKQPGLPHPDPVSSTVRLPGQVRLPAGAQVYGAGMYGTAQYLIGPAGLPCDNSYPGLSAGMWAFVGEDAIQGDPKAGPQVSANYLPGSTSVQAEAACSAFGKDASELNGLLHVTDCAQRDEGTTDAIPTNTPKFYVNAQVSVAGGSINTEAQTLSLDGGHTTRSISCVLPRSQADICTAALTFFIILQSKGTLISPADLDRISQTIADRVARPQ